MSNWTSLPTLPSGPMLCQAEWRYLRHEASLTSFSWFDGKRFHGYWSTAAAADRHRDERSIDHYAEAIRWRPAEASKPAPAPKSEEHAFELWLAKTRPSGNCEAVHALWLKSLDRAEFFEHAPPPGTLPEGYADRYIRPSDEPGIKADGRTRHLGRYATAAEAHQVYVAAKRQFHEGNTL